MLGGPSALEQPSTSWGSTGAQQTNQTLPESPAVGSIPHCNHPSTSYPQAAVTPAANDSEFYSFSFHIFYSGIIRFRYKKKTIKIKTGAIFTLDASE